MQHAKFHKKLNFNKLIILDCLAENDYQTARRLHENLSDKGYGDGISLLKIHDENTFRDTIQDIKDVFNPEFSLGIQPIIHIEAHGNPLSLELPDKSMIPWSDLAEDFRIINKAMGNELITFIGTCHGYHFIFNNHTIKEFAPVYFCIAPLEKIASGDIECSALLFYVNLFSTGDLSRSANLLDASIFYTYNSDYMFHRAFHETMQQHHRGETLRLRKETLISEAIDLMGASWEAMSPKEKEVYLSKARKYLSYSLKSKESLRAEFERFSIGYMGYAKEEVFEEIWNHMQHNKQGRIY